MSDRSLKSTIVATALVATVVLAGCSGSSPSSSSETALPPGHPSTDTQSAASQAQGGVTELITEDTKAGKGSAVEDGDTVVVHYSGWLLDGTKFDSSLERDDPFEFTIGDGNVIEGWEKGLIGMKEGGTRRLTIPPSLGYGDQGAGGVIPPNATLLFEIELLEVK